MLQNGIFMVIFILFFSIFLAACGIGNIWCQLLGKRQDEHRIGFLRDMQIKQVLPQGVYLSARYIRVLYP